MLVVVWGWGWTHRAKSSTPRTQWLLREGEAEGLGTPVAASSLIDDALRHGPIGSEGGQPRTTNPTAAAVIEGRKEECPSVHALAQRLRGCLEVRRGCWDGWYERQAGSEIRESIHACTRC